MNGYKIHILMGLPGSGKTFFANSFSPTFINYFNLDSNHGHIKSAYLRDLLDRSRTREVIFDGLILTVKDLKFLIDICLGWKKNEDFEFNIYYWKENREGCLCNDELRVKDYFGRDKNSSVTIKNAIFDSPETIINFLNSYSIKFNFYTKEVYSPDKLDLVIKKYGPTQINGEYVITSESWSNGGTWCDWRGESMNVEPESPIEFTAFDDLLVEICPSITFLQYKKIYQQCVILDTYEEHDYYGGSTSNSRYKCVVDTLKKTLREIGLKVTL